MASKYFRLGAMHCVQAYPLHVMGRAFLKRSRGDTEDEELIRLFHKSESLIMLQRDIAIQAHLDNLQALKDCVHELPFERDKIYFDDIGLIEDILKRKP